MVDRPSKGLDELVLGDDLEDGDCFYGSLEGQPIFRIGEGQGRFEDKPYTGAIQLNICGLLSQIHIKLAEQDASADLACEILFVTIEAYISDEC